MADDKVYGSGMMGGVLAGNIGRDPELGYTKDGLAYTKFSVAVTHVHSQEQVTNWYNVTIWGRKGFGRDADYNNNYPEWAANAIRKGDRFCAVDSHLEPRTYEDKDGNERLSLDVRIGNIVSYHEKDRPESDDSNGRKSASRTTKKPAAARSKAKTEDWDDDDAQM